LVEALNALVGGLRIEKTFGTQLRDHAIRISRERHEARRETAGEGFRGADVVAGDK